MKSPKVKRVNQKGVGKLNQRIGLDFLNFDMEIQLYHTQQILTKFLWYASHLARPKQGSQVNIYGNIITTHLPMLETLEI